MNLYTCFQSYVTDDVELLFILKLTFLILLLLKGVPEVLKRF
jgi:hypothetical protein